MKILRICVYVVFRLLADIFCLAICVMAFPGYLYHWSKQSKSIVRYYIGNGAGLKFMPFYTTIKTIKQIWRS